VGPAVRKRKIKRDEKRENVRASRELQLVDITRMLAGPLAWPAGHFPFFYFFLFSNFLKTELAVGCKI
jgi:hypothetical protein